MTMNINKQTIAYFIKQAMRYPAYVIALLIALPITVTIHQFIPPIIAASVLDRLASGKYNPGDWWGSFGGDLILYALCIFFGGVIAWRFCIYLVWKLEINVLRAITLETFAHIMLLDANFHANHFGGTLVSQASKFNGAYMMLADTTLFSSYTLIIALVASSIILWSKAPLFVIAMIVFTLFFVTTSSFISRKVRKLNAIEADTGNELTGKLADSITNVAAVKSFAANAAEQKRFTKTVNKWQKADINLMNASLLQQGYFSMITSSLSSAALILATISVVAFKADVAVIFLVVSFANNIAQRLWEFSQVTLRNYNRALGNAKGMMETLNTQPTVQDPVGPEQPRITKGAIAFTDVTFAHADAKNDVLFKNLNLSIGAGKKVGLVGQSGSGKTTLTRLLLRFIDINSGAITIDGQNIANITQDDLRRNIAYVPQEPLLFHRSLRENIAYGKPGATFDEVKQAARKAHAADFIDKLPNGYETEVGERGVKLSGGQRQRIAIARAILKDAPILVLDEATSALDSESEKLIQDALWELMQGRTTIVIAHRLSTVQRMDEIVVLKDGAIVQQGSHNALLKKGGAYADLWRHQTGGFIEE